MNIQNYTFESHWNSIDEVKPPISERVLFSDGNSIVIGSYLIQDETTHWIFDRQGLDGYTPIVWMKLPNCKVVSGKD